VEQAIRSTAVPHLDLITGSIELANADLVLGDVTGREVALKQLLEGVHGRYDYIILDCPPHFSLISINALLAADALIIPTVPQHLAVEGMLSLLASLDRVRKRFGAGSRLLGILITMVDSGEKSAAEVRDQLRTQYRERVFHTEIGLSRALSKAPASRQTIFEYAPRSRAADAFKRLAGEVLERLRR
jgi:chromosome partitioning protein